MGAADGALAYGGRVTTSSGGTQAIDELVDWDLAVRAATRLARPGPAVSRAQAHEAVAELRACAVASTPHVGAATGLAVPAGEGVLVVDRTGWAAANVAAFRSLLGPPAAAAARRRNRPLSPVATAVGARVTGAEVGSLLAYLSSRVLGQYDIFGEPSAAGPPGRLLLVAPNVLHVERELAVDPADFRMWVCLHEETHRVQFMANPWLRGHLVGRSRALVGDLMEEPSAVVNRLTATLKDLPELLRSGQASGTGLLELIQTPEQRQVLAELTAIMSLLEGHADVVMDDVGPQVVPTVGEIRRRFTRRRAGQGALDQLLRRLLGLEAKMRQYADGAVFVRAVVDKVGMDGFNRVWTSPETLPLPTEISDPAAWVRRVHG